jgi:hypothetical protein
MRHQVATVEQAAAVVEYFNGFHDGFIHRLTLVSHDTFEDRDTHVTTGLLDLEIVFAHSNYREGSLPFDQIVKARFTSVRDLQMNFTGAPTDWPITGFHLDAEASPISGDAARLRARMMQPRLVDNARWEQNEALSFSFASAEFCEARPASTTA